MRDNYEIDEDGVIHWQDRQEEPESDQDKLMAEYAALEHEVVNSIAHHTDNPEKIARYYELKSILGIPDTVDVFKQGIKILNEKEKKQMESENKEFWAMIKKFRDSGKK